MWKRFGTGKPQQSTAATNGRSPVRGRTPPMQRTQSSDSRPIGRCADEGKYPPPESPCPSLPLIVYCPPLPDPTGTSTLAPSRPGPAAHILFVRRCLALLGALLAAALIVPAAAAEAATCASRRRDHDRHHERRRRRRPSPTSAGALTLNSVPCVGAPTVLNTNTV